MHVVLHVQYSSTPLEIPSTLIIFNWIGTQRYFPSSSSLQLCRVKAEQRGSDVSAILTSPHRLTDGERVIRGKTRMKGERPVFSGKAVRMHLNDTISYVSWVGKCFTIGACWVPRKLSSWSNKPWQQLHWTGALLFLSSLCKNEHIWTSTFHLL